MNEAKNCGNCKHWVGNVLKAADVGFCVNPTVPAGRSCTAAMVCDGHEKTQNPVTNTPMETHPLRQAIPGKQEGTEGLAIGVNVEARQVVFIINDVVRLAMIDPYRIDEITKTAMRVTPLNPSGDEKGPSVWMKIGEFAMEKDWRLTSVVRDKINGVRNPMMTNEQRMAMGD